jgi:uncharacterized delta-60 repeat protein
MLTSHSLLRHAIATATALALLVAAPVAHASKGSIVPASFRSVAFGTNAYAADLAFIEGEPCVLVGGVEIVGRASAQLACGRTMGRRYRVNLSVPFERVSAFDVEGDHVDIVGSRILARATHNGAMVETFGIGGGARLQDLAPSGHANVQLRDVDSLADGSVVAVGDATTRRDRDGELVAFVIKVRPDGTLDPGFGAGGVAQVAVPGFDRAAFNSVRVLDDGRILGVGWASTALDADFASFAALLETDGTLATSFSGDGVVAASDGSDTTYTSVPDGRAGGSFPIHVSGSVERRGEVKPFVVRIESNGTIASWGGAAAHRVVTVFELPRGNQHVDVALLPDGSVVGAAERMANGEYDSFVARFRPATGAPDTAFASGGFEPIDTRPGVLDDEWSSAIAVDPTGVPWIAGGNVVGGRRQVHLFRVTNEGSARTARWTGASVFLAKGDDLLECGTSVRRACSVARGRVAEVFVGVDERPVVASPLLRPFLRIWSKSPGKAWKLVERPIAAGVFRNGVVADVPLRLGAGRHEVTVHRNGFATTGAAWSSPLHLVVR